MIIYSNNTQVREDQDFIRDLFDRMRAEWRFPDWEESDWETLNDMIVEELQGGPA